MIKLLLIILLLCFCGLRVECQGTSMDLRNDGRIIFGPRKDYFLNRIKSNQTSVGSDLRNKLTNTLVSAMVIPPGKTGNRYLIGIIIGKSTLPTDWEVTEAEFKSIRAFSTNQMLSSVEQKYDEIQQSSGMSNTSLVTKHVAELRTIIKESGNEAESGEAYAGYLLAYLDKTPEISQFADLVAKYRAETQRSIDPSVAKVMALVLAEPFALTESNEPIKFGDLSSFPVERSVAGPGKTGYLSVWKGRALIIVPERLFDPFSQEKYKGGLAQYLAADPATAKNSIILARAR